MSRYPPILVLTQSRHAKFCSSQRLPLLKLGCPFLLIRTLIVNSLIPQFVWFRFHAVKLIKIHIGLVVVVGLEGLNSLIAP